MYLNYYHLREEPFRLTPDPKFLQLAGAHREALTTLARGVLERRGLMLLTGPIGTGKTTILNGLLSVVARRDPAKPFPTALIVNPRLTSDELLETLLLEFAVPYVSTSRPARLAALQRLLFHTSANGATCLLVVDEAHLLSQDLLEEIRVLMNTESYKEKLLQVILCGQPELGDHLNDPAVRALQQRIAARAYLRPLSLSETRMYVSERLQTAGLEQLNPFMVPALDRIYEFTGGVPRLINIICDTCLTIGSETSRAYISEDIVEEAAVRHEMNNLAGAGQRPALAIDPLASPKTGPGAGHWVGNSITTAKVTSQGEL